MGREEGVEERRDRGRTSGGRGGEWGVGGRALAPHPLIPSSLHPFIPFSYLSPMNGVQLHFLFNHVPMFLALFALILWVVNFFKPTAIVKSLAMIIMVVMGLMSMAAMATGEEAEEVMEEWGMNHRAIHEQEELAEVAHFSALGMAVLTIIVFFIERKKQTEIKAFPFIAMIGLVGVLVTMSIAAHEGGKLSHPELYQTPPAGLNPQQEEEHESHEH